MAPPTTTPKIEELRFRLKTDPKNRAFYLLAEELRRIGQFAEAEQVLRTGLAHHATYLSAWVSLGRVLREEKKDHEAIDALTKALALDPGNVVAARLLADAYLEVGEKVEAIKKYKLVQALLSPDEQLEAVIARLDREINAPSIALSTMDEEPVFERLEEKTAQPPAAEAANEPPAEEPQAEETQAGETGEASPGVAGPGAVAAFAAQPPAFASVWDESPLEEPLAESPAAEPAVADGPVQEPEPALLPAAPPAPTADDSPWLEETPPAAEPAPGTSAEPAVEVRPATAVLDDTSPMPPPREESPFGEPVPTGGNGELGSEASPVAAGSFGDGMRSRIEGDLSAGIAAEELPLDPAPVDVFGTEEETPAAEAGAEPTDVTDTLTMADLYARQGLVAEARDIYEHILQRDPSNEGVHARLAALGDARTSGAPAGKAAAGEEPAGDGLAPGPEFAAVAGIERSKNVRRSEKLAPEPESAAVAGAVEPAAATPAGTARAKIERLERWMAKVARREVPRVQ